MKFPNYKMVMINPGKEVDPDTVVVLTSLELKSTL